MRKLSALDKRRIHGGTGRTFVHAPVLRRDARAGRTDAPLRRRRRPRRPELLGGAGPDARLRRTQRGREDHGDADRARRARAGRGHRALERGARSTAPMRARFGYMPEERGLYPKMRVREQLVYFARLHALGAAGRRGRRRPLDRAARPRPACRRPRRDALARQPAARPARRGARPRPGGARARRAVLRAGPDRGRRDERRAARARRGRRARGLLLAPARARRAAVRRRRDHQGRPARGLRRRRRAA